MRNSSFIVFLIFNSLVYPTKRETVFEQAVSKTAWQTELKSLIVAKEIPGAERVCGFLSREKIEISELKFTKSFQTGEKIFILELWQDLLNIYCHLFTIDESDTDSEHLTIPASVASEHPSIGENEVDDNSSASAYSSEGEDGEVLHLGAGDMIGEIAEKADTLLQKELIEELEEESVDVLRELCPIFLRRVENKGPKLSDLVAGSSSEDLPEEASSSTKTKPNLDLVLEFPQVDCESKCELILSPYRGSESLHLFFEELKPTEIGLLDTENKLTQTELKLLDADPGPIGDSSGTSVNRSARPPAPILTEEPVAEAVLEEELELKASPHKRSESRFMAEEVECDSEEELSSIAEDLITKLTEQVMTSEAQTPPSRFYIQSLEKGESLDSVCTLGPRLNVSLSPREGLSSASEGGEKVRTPEFGQEEDVHSSHFDAKEEKFDFDGTLESVIMAIQNLHPDSEIRAIFDLEKAIALANKRNRGYGNTEAPWIILNGYRSFRRKLKFRVITTQEPSFWERAKKALIRASSIQSLAKKVIKSPKYKTIYSALLERLSPQQALSCFSALIIIALEEREQEEARQMRDLQLREEDFYQEENAPVFTLIEEKKLVKEPKNRGTIGAGMDTAMIAALVVEAVQPSITKERSQGSVAIQTEPQLELDMQLESPPKARCRGREPTPEKQAPVEHIEERREPAMPSDSHREPRRRGLQMDFSLNVQSDFGKQNGGGSGALPRIANLATAAMVDEGAGAFHADGGRFWKIINYLVIGLAILAAISLIVLGIYALVKFFPVAIKALT